MFKNIIIVLGILFVLFVSYSFYTSNKGPEMMTLNLFIQNKEIARTRDCAVTQMITVEVPKTLAVADVSVRILFEDELAQYGKYKNATLENGVAKVYLESTTTLNGKPLISLSSCEIGHIQSVLRDTLTQYETIKSVELYSPRGRVEF